MNIWSSVLFTLYEDRMYYGGMLKTMVIYKGQHYFN